MKTTHFTAMGLALVLAFAVASDLRAENALYPAIKDSLVKSKGKDVETFDAAPLQNTKYIAIYYSASWCPPCRAFTPDLVKWYKRNKTKNPHFELIFVSSDKSAKDMAAYMKDDDMEWPALAFEKKKETPALTKYSGKGIPCLVLIDDTGKVLSDSYVDGTYVGPRKVLADIEKTLKDNPATGAAAGTGSSSGSALDRFKSTSTSTSTSR